MAVKKRREWQGDYSEIEHNPATCKLPKEVTVILPDTCPDDCQEIVHNLITDMSGWFGGTTVTHSEGCWVSDEKELVCEPVVKIESSHQCLSKEMERKFIKRVTDDAKRMKQYALALKTDHLLVITLPSYIDPND
jgi:hypothetical protein